MVYISGDKHGDFRNVLFFCYSNRTTIDDILIILGDAGINYNCDYNDYILKDSLKNNYPITLFCIHGNHEERPENIKSYKTKKFHNGVVYYEENYPNILFAKDGEIYSFNNKKVLVIGGAYSVDKYFRIANGLKWYESEQPNDKIKKRVNKVLSKNHYKVDIILSHTCPYKYIPREMFLNNVNQSIVDNSTERYLDNIDNQVKYDKWYCGHFHTDKKVDNIVFMFNNIDIFN